MRIVIIGAAGHGKSTLAKVIEHLSNVKCEVMNTNDLRDFYNEQQQKRLEPRKELLEIGEEFILETKKVKHPSRKKGKEIKPWQRTRFYQK